MGKKHKKPPKNALEGINDFTLAQLIVSLEKHLKAKKTLFLTHKGVVVSSRTVVDHKAQLRAAEELAKLHDLFPRRGDLRAHHAFDRAGPPVINLVMPGPVMEGQPPASYLKGRFVAF